MRAGVYLLFILILVAGCKKKNSNTPPHTQTCYVGKETIWSGNSRRSIYTFQTDPDGSLRYTTYQDTLDIYWENRPSRMAVMKLPVLC